MSLHKACASSQRGQHSRNLNHVDSGSSIQRAARSKSQRKSDKKAMKGNVDPGRRRQDITTCV
jgi:hypothetical protein